jgi:hypothetical protein
MDPALQTAWPMYAFPERQRRWDGFPRSFIQNNGRGKRPNIWSITVYKDRVITEYGVQGGEMQTTNYGGKVKNAGRSNAITAEQDALAEARRDVRKKWEFEGYDELWDGVNIDKRNQDVSVQHLLTALPGSFCLYKPENNFWDQKKLVAKAQEGKVWYTVKRDGMAKWIVVDYFGNVQIYSRRSRPYHKDEGPRELEDGTLDYSTTIPWSLRFPHLVKAIEVMKLPPGTMLAGELIYTETEDNFPYMQSLTKSLTPQALGDMVKHGLPLFYCWDVPFLGGEDLVTTRPVGYRLPLIADFKMSAFLREQNPALKYFLPIVIENFANPDLALEEAKKRGIEGWVVVDPLGIYGDKGWTLKGKPDRPSVCAKLKPKQEDDFIAYWRPNDKDPETGDSIGTWGTGKHELDKYVTLPDGSKVVHGGVGSIALYQYNSKGEMVFISNCSSGMDYAFQANLRASNFPFVCKVEYPERTYKSDGEKTNALRHPVFLMVRTDKDASECVNSRL